MSAVPDRATLIQLLAAALPPEAAGQAAALAEALRAGAQLTPAQQAALATLRDGAATLDPALAAVLAQVSATGAGATAINAGDGASVTSSQMYGVVNLGSGAQAGDISVTIQQAGTPPPRPAFQVPYPPNPLFRGRDAELAALARLLLGEASGAAAVLPAVAGTGGIGKTQLASEFAHRHRDAFPGGVFWLTMAQPESVAAQVAAAGGPGGLDLPGWQAMDFETRVAAVRGAWNESTRRLLVFDNLEEPKLLAAWRPTGDGARVLVTTRRGVWTATSGVQPVPLLTLARPESVRLLLAPRYGAPVEAALADPATAQAADAICDQVGDLPLALALAGAYLEQTPSMSLAGYQRRLEAELLAHPSLEAELEEVLPTRHIESIAATIALSYGRLDPAKRADALALLLLGRAAHLAPAPIPQRLLVRLADYDPDDEGQAAEVDSALRGLAAVGLIDLLPAGGAMLHRLVAAFARVYDADGAATRAKVAQGLIDEVYAINEAGYPQRGQAYLPHLVNFAQLRDQLVAEQESTLVCNLGRLLNELGNLAGARPYYERALAIDERVLGPEHLATARSLNNLGLLLHNLGDLAGARPYLERALAIDERVLGPEHPSTARSLNNLGLLLYTLGDLVGARPYYERAVVIMEQVLGLDHPETATSLNNLGMLLHNLGDLARARLYLERALTIRERVLGPGHPDTASSLNNLGELLHDLGDLAGARHYLEQAVAIWKQVLGSEHPTTAHGLNNLGVILHDLGDLAGARIYLEQALAIREQVLGLEHADTASSLNNLGWLLHDLEDLAGARASLERALAINERVLGPEHPTTGRSLNNLGMLLYSLGDLTGARASLERALAIDERVLGPEHPDTARSLHNLGVLLHAQGDLMGAWFYYTRALSIYERVLGSEHPDTRRVCESRAALIGGQAAPEL